VTAEGDRLRRVVAQHALTARLLGADAVPMPRDGGSDRSVGAEVAVKPVPRVKPTDRPASQARLDELRARYESEAPHEQFNTTFTKIVFGEGDPCARLMFVGEAPGAEEDKTGRPFVGKAGELLEKMIVAMGLSRETVYIANVLKTRPPNNATPTIDEMRLCAPYLYEQIAIVQPEVIVSLGKPAAQCLLDTTEAMGRLRGQWAQFPPAGSLDPVPGFDQPIPVMPTYHPAYLLRAYTDDNRAKVWSDLKMAMDRLGLRGRKPAAK
jgi:uracil-DNA glycosylase family 4